MIKKHVCMVLDTETINGSKFPLIHDIAFQIVDKDFNVLTSYRALVAEFHEYGKELLTSSNFYIGKAHKYETAIQNGTVDIKPYNAIIADLMDAIKAHNVTCICAYNLNFDKRALRNTAQIFNIELKDAFDRAYNRLKELCLWNLACSTILNTEDYRAWATRYGAIKESGNYHTNVESCYQYITDNADYIEDHTALEDVIDETEILRHITTTVQGRAPYGIRPNCWRQVQR